MKTSTSTHKVRFRRHIASISVKIFIRIWCNLNSILLGKGCGCGGGGVGESCCRGGRTLLVAIVLGVIYLSLF